jgi:hypothetical protein
VLVGCVTVEYQDCFSNGGKYNQRCVALITVRLRLAVTCKYDPSDIRIDTFCLNRKTDNMHYSAEPNITRNGCQCVAHGLSLFPARSSSSSSDACWFCSDKRSRRTVA